MPTSGHPRHPRVTGPARPPLDPVLLDLARDERVHNAGTRLADFGRINVAVARVRVGKAVEYLAAGNLPHGEGGVHSEEYLVSQIEALRAPGRLVLLEQLYSERRPCPSVCRPLLQAYWPSAAVFYSVGWFPLRPFHRSKAEQLRSAWGLG